MTHPAIRTTVALGLAATLSGCSLIGLLNALSDAGASRARAAIRYAGPTAPARLALDAYVPRPGRHRRPGPRPVVVFFYGGFWESGARRDYAFVGEALAEQGFVAVLPDYRVYPEVRFPAFLEDGARAVRWAVDHAAELGGDPARVFVMGHSAGAHIAAMLALDERWLREAGVRRSRLRGMVGLAGLYAFAPDDLPFAPAKTADLFGVGRAWAETQPITYVDGGEPPLYLLHGEPDELVKVGNTQRLAERVRALGGRVDVRTYAGMGHEAIVAALARPTRFAGPVLADVAGWLEGND